MEDVSYTEMNGEDGPRAALSVFLSNESRKRKNTGLPIKKHLFKKNLNYLQKIRKKQI